MYCRGSDSNTLGDGAALTSEVTIGHAPCEAPGIELLELMLESGESRPLTALVRVALLRASGPCLPAGRPGLWLRSIADVVHEYHKLQALQPGCHGVQPGFEVYLCG